MRYKLLVFVCCLLSYANTSRAYEVGGEEFTEDHPLVYEDAWDLWPYVFLNEHGEAVGYNVDLLKLIFNELKIPYVIRLKPTVNALEDLKAGRSDLMLGMDAYFHHEYAMYGKSVVQLFTHSVVHRKDEPAKVQNVEDLAQQRVIVHEGSFSHHLMKQRGWGANAIPINDMQEAVHLAHNEAGHQIIWNTMSLKWLIRKFHYDDLALTPVRVAHGEYKFMSNNTELLNKLDSVYTVLNASGRLQPIQTRWFYPDRKDSGIPSWIWVVIGVAVVVTLLSLVMYLFYRRQERRMTRTVRRSNNRLALILKTSNVHIWVYHVATKTVTTYDADGKVEADKLTPNFFFYSMLREDSEQILKALEDISKRVVSKRTVHVRSKSGSEGEICNLVIILSALNVDKNGRPADIMGTTSDVTEDSVRQQKVKDAMLRYKTIFNSGMVDIVSYDEHGVIIDLNEKAKRAFVGRLSQVLDAKITVADVLGDESLTPENIEYTHLTQLLYGDADDQRALNKYLRPKEMYYELQLQPVRDDKGKLQAVYGTGRNVTETVKSYRLLQQNIREVERANKELGEYIRNIDFVLQNGGVRLVHYHLETHTLEVYSEIGQVQLTLTQMRALSFVTSDSQIAALRVFNSMDSHVRQTLQATVKTTLRHRGGMAYESCPLCLYFSLVPVFSEDGKHVVGYFGLCRDVSETQAVEENLALEAARAQEVETVKNAFLRNMSYQIRTPLNSVVGFAELFELEHAPEDESLFIQQINDNSSLLLKLINDILFLSRLDAQMIEIKKQPTNFAEIFEVRCQTAWFSYQRTGVKYVAENGYEKLVLDIDEQNLGIVIEKILVNAAQHTAAGEVRASYTYTGEDLVMTFQDTGCGIPADRLQHVFDRFSSSDGQSSGLGLSISHEMVQQMGGKIKIQSEPGKGTIVWVTIPCACSEMVRK